MHEKDKEPENQQANHQENPQNEAQASELNQTPDQPENGENASTEDESIPDNSAEKTELALAEAKDKYVRLYAEFENFRRRSVKEKSDTIKNANENLLKDLLPVVDDFERGIKTMNEAEKLELKDPEAMQKEIQALREGLQLVYNKFQKILESKGLKPIPSSIGKPFDLEEHESVTQFPTQDESMKGKVVDELEKGYYLHDKVIRFAKVVIGM